MPVVLARIDDRLIHGQVTVGWSELLRPDRIILANNAIAADSWQNRSLSGSIKSPPLTRQQSSSWWIWTPILPNTSTAASVSSELSGCIISLSPLARAAHISPRMV